MRSLWVFHRRLVVAVAIVVVLVLSTGVVLAESHRVVPHQKESPASGPAARGSQVAPKTQTHSIKQSQSKSPIRHLIANSLTHPPQTVVQKRVDTELAQAETSASIFAARESGVPVPAVSAAYPSIPTADRSDPSAYAVAFATELLDTNYATQSRAPSWPGLSTRKRPIPCPVSRPPWPARRSCCPWPTPTSPAVRHRPCPPKRNGPVIPKATWCNRSAVSKQRSIPTGPRSSQKVGSPVIRS